MYEKKPDTCVRAGELANEYDQVRKQEPGVEQWPEPMTGVQSRRSVPGSLECPGEDSSSKKQSAKGAAGRSLETGTEGMRCFLCRQFGHIKKDCPERAVEKVLFTAEEKQEPFSRQQLEMDLRLQHKGQVEDQEVQDILLDTGCARTMVRVDLVPPKKFLDDAVQIKCAHSDVVLYPLANVEMEVDGLKVEVEAAVSGGLPAAVLLGKDVPGFDQLIGNTEPSLERRGCQEEALVVVTRAQACQQLERELPSREKGRTEDRDGTSYVYSDR